MYKQLIYKENSQKFLWPAISLGAHILFLSIALNTPKDAITQSLTFRPNISAKLVINQIREKKEIIVEKKVIKKQKKAIKKAKKTIAKKEVKPLEKQNHIINRAKKFDKYIKHFEKPRYPKVALRRGIEGTVELKLILLPNGEVLRIEILKSSGSSILDNSALSAAKKWQFSSLGLKTSEEITINKKIVFTTRL